MLQRRPDAARRCAPELALGGTSNARLACGQLRVQGTSCSPKGGSAGCLAPRSAAAAHAPGALRAPKPASRLAETGRSRTQHFLSGAPPLQLVAEFSSFSAKSQAGAHAGEWLRAIPTDKGTQLLLPLDMQVALRDSNIH